MSNIKEITDADYEELVIKSDTPIVVDFWAPWCGPCKSMLPVLQDLASEFSENVTFVKINVDENPEAPVALGIKSIPTFAFYKGGEVVAQLVGTLPRATLLEKLNDVV